jgi:hypothetical protein
MFSQVVYDAAADWVAVKPKPLGQNHFDKAVVVLACIPSSIDNKLNESLLAQFCEQDCQF